MFDQIAMNAIDVASEVDCIAYLTFPGSILPNGVFDLCLARCVGR